MKYIITGSIGNISRPIVIALVKAGHNVTVISSSQDRAAEITSLGAIPAVGSVEDPAFLQKTFKGADAAYTMVPPVMRESGWKQYIGQIGKNYAAAIKDSGIRYVVNLSSIGAHMPDGAGPVSGLHTAEEALNALSDVNIKHLRAAYFYLNFLNSINLVKNAGIIGSNYAFNEKTFPLVHPEDIATVAIEALLQHNFTGHSVQYVVSDLVSTDHIATAIGKEVGKPDLKWVQFTDEQALQGGIAAGLPEEISKNYAEMGHALQSGEMAADYWQQQPPVTGKIKLEDFAQMFGKVYQGATN